MENIILEANFRDKINKAERNKIRKEGRVPGIYYSKHEKPMAFNVDEKDINPLVFTSARNIILLKVKGKEEQECFLKNVQFDPVTDKIVHFDLLGLKRGEKFQLNIPVSFVGNSVGVKEGGVLQIGSHKLFVECLPKDVPQSLEIDIENLNIGDTIHIKDLNFENITILTPADSVVVSVTHPKVEAEPVVDELEEGMAEPEVIGKTDEETGEKEENKE
ncbi:MAG TPA: 50S ribosomal protein L25 [Ignavibacteria bacterium]|nr:50S ribosomal protein L25 [Ignavibacteria bacterium]